MLIQDTILKCWKDLKHNLIKEYLILKQIDIDGIYENNNFYEIFNNYNLYFFNNLFKSLICKIFYFFNKFLFSF